MYRLKLRIRFVLSDKIASPESVVFGSRRRRRRSKAKTQVFCFAIPHAGATAEA
jgi:hypothetical protein